MKVIAIMGSPRKSGQTTRIMKVFEEELKRILEVEFEYLYLQDYKIDECEGCALCIKKGHEYCPLKDEHQSVVDKILAVDGIIYATPNYAMQVSGLLKKFMERMAYSLHRPMFFGKVFTNIVPQGAYGATDINKYLDKFSQMGGGYMIKGSGITVLRDTTFYPGKEWSPSEYEALRKQLHKQIKSFAKALIGNRYPTPTTFQAATFYASRCSHKYEIERNKDYEYFESNGWFTSDYYYETHMNIGKRLLGVLIDRMQKHIQSK